VGRVAEMKCERY